MPSERIGELVPKDQIPFTREMVLTPDKQRGLTEKASIITYI